MAWNARVERRRAFQGEVLAGTENESPYATECQSRRDFSHVSTVTLVPCSLTE
jgi:hypothetical protein